MVERREHLADLAGRLPRLPQHRIEVQNMVARFVAVGVLPDQPRDVGRGLAAFDDRTYRKERIQLFNHLRTRAEQPFEALDIVRSQPGVLPGVALAVVVGAVRRGERIEGRPPALPRIPAPHEARRRVEIVAVASGCAPRNTSHPPPCPASRRHAPPHRRPKRTPCHRPRPR